MSLESAGRETIVLAQKKGLHDVDVFLQRSDDLQVQIRDGKVETVEQSTNVGLGVRVLKNGRSGFASTERLDSDALQWALQKACDNGVLQDPTDVVMVAAAEQVADADDLGLLNPAVDELEVDDLSELGLEIESAALNADSRVTAIPNLGISRSRSETRLMSTHGIDHYQRSNVVSAFCSTLIEDGDLRKSGSESWVRREWDRAGAIAIGAIAVQKGCELLGAESVPGGPMPVVLDEYCSPRLLGMYFQAFSGEAAQKGTSRLKGLLQEEIAVKNLTLTDDPHRKGALRSRYIDAEGSTTKPLHLIEGGVFKNFIYHVESARRDDVAPTGHASRSYKSGISTATHNLVLPRGSHSLEELCSIPESCLLVTRLEGGAGCNPISGDISIGVQGFLVRHGKRTQAVDSVTIAGNFFDLLKQIEAVGNCYQPNLTSHFIPALLLDGLVVSG